MKNKKIMLIARNKQGASVVYYGKSKAEAYNNFAFDYSSKGFKIEYVDVSDETNNLKKQ